MAVDESYVDPKTLAMDLRNLRAWASHFVDERDAISHLISSADLDEIVRYDLLPI